MSVAVLYKFECENSVAKYIRKSTSFMVCVKSLIGHVYDMYHWILRQWCVYSPVYPQRPGSQKYPPHSGKSGKDLWLWSGPGHHYRLQLCSQRKCKLLCIDCFVCLSVLHVSFIFFCIFIYLFFFSFKLNLLCCWVVLALLIHDSVGLLSR